PAPAIVQASRRGLSPVSRTHTSCLVSGVCPRVSFRVNPPRAAACLARGLVGGTGFPPRDHPWIETINGMIKIATMFVILIIGLIAGPAVSLYGSPTVSPVTAAAWASEPFPP